MIQQFFFCHRCHSTEIRIGRGELHSQACGVIIPKSQDMEMTYVCVRG